jgi:hypothetical protein
MGGPPVYEDGFFEHRQYQTRVLRKLNHVSEPVLARLGLVGAKLSSQEDQTGLLIIAQV